MRDPIGDGRREKGRAGSESVEEDIGRIFLMNLNHRRTGMERLALTYRFKPGKKEEYIKAHKEAWPEILQGLKEAGCHEMTIFRSSPDT